MRALDVLAVRRLLAEQWSDGRGEEFTRVTLRWALDREGAPRQEDKINQAAAGVAERVSRHLRAAEVYHVSATMTDVVEVAARSMPQEPLAPEHLPSGCGLLVLDRPVCRVPEALLAENVPLLDGLGWDTVTWGPCPNPMNGLEPGVIFVFGLTRTGAERSLAAIREERIPTEGEGLETEIQRIAAAEAKIRGLVSRAGVVGLSQSYASWGSREEGAQCVRTLLAALSLMQQKITSSTVVNPDRHERRRNERAGLPPTPVRVIELRRVEGLGEHGEPGSVDWSCRWLVRGHWRRQRYADGTVRQVWITPHIKGPEGLPLRSPEKVYTLRR